MATKIDLLGKKIGKWTIIKKAENIGKRTAWLCKCECGNEKVVATEVLVKNQSKSCGCSRYDHLKNKISHENLEGRKFGKLTVKNFNGIKKERAYWLCKCECGNEKITSGKLLKNGNCISCGCVQKEIASRNSKTHGKSKTRIYYIWQGMKERCNNPNNLNYFNYGGRGIEVFDDWNKFEEFEKWSMLNGYNDDLSIERINVNGGYNPNNCTWIPLRLQSRNRRNVINIEFNGTVKTLTEWSKYFNVSHSTIQYHIKKDDIESTFAKWELMQNHKLSC